MAITQTDKAVIFACATTFLTFLINAKRGSIWLLYLNVLIITGVFGFTLRRWDEFSHLSRSVITSAIALIVYLPLDWYISQKVHLIFYLSLNDVRVPAVPLSLLLTWVVALTVTIYSYQRLSSIWKYPYISAVITGAAVFISSVVLDRLGSARLWNWNASYLENFPYIGTIPAFVPIALSLTILLSPYYFRGQNLIVAGLRCGICMGAMQFFGFLLFFYYL